MDAADPFKRYEIRSLLFSSKTRHYTKARSNLLSAGARETTLGRHFRQIPPPITGDRKAYDFLFSLSLSASAFYNRSDERVIEQKRT